MQSGVTRLKGFSLPNPSINPGCALFSMDAASSIKYSSCSMASYNAIEPSFLSGFAAHEMKRVAVPVVEFIAALTDLFPPNADGTAMQTRARRKRLLLF